VRAVILPSFQAPLEVEERAVPQPSDGQVLVKVLACGVCHSDLHVVEGYFSSAPLPLVLGHEIAGELEDGQRVLVYAPWGCGECRFCLATEEMICPEGREAGMFQDGGYAEYVRVPAQRYIYPIGDLDPVTAAPLACGGLTAYRAVKHARPWLKPGTRALVLGAGGLGQFGIQFIRHLTDGAVVAGDPSDVKRARAIELGAEAAADPADLDGPFDAVLDFVGSDESLARAAELVDRKGVAIVIGLFGGTIPFGLGAVPHEAHFLSSIWGSRDELEDLIALAQRETIEHTVETLPLEQAQTAHDRLRAGDTRGRLVLVP
jgi:propanol-preferring alcohol dehydrogenase